MNVKRCAPRTERQKSHPPEDSADRHLTAADMWAKLLDRSENLLQAYRDTLILYAKWHNFARDFLPRLAKYTAACEWTAVDVLRDMAAQEDVLVDYGAASTLRDVTQKLERYFAGETTTLVDKKRCVELLEQLCGIITLDHPREHPSETSMENRRLLEGEFERAATKVRLWIFRLMYCLDTYTALAAEEENDKDAAENAAGDTAKEPGDVATPRRARSRGKIPNGEAANARVFEDSARRESDESGSSSTHENRCRPCYKRTLAKFTKLPAIQACVRWANLEALGTVEALEREALLKGDVDSLHDKTWADLMPSGAPWPRNLDEPSFCATPGPVKGTRVSRNPDGSPRDFSRPHVSVFDDEDEWNARENAPREHFVVPLTSRYTVMYSNPSTTRCKKRLRHLKRSFSDSDLDDRREDTAKKQKTKVRFSDW